ncbi:hypothetical protein PG995_015463 [Apiospora arundinis]
MSSRRSREQLDPIPFEQQTAESGSDSSSKEDNEPVDRHAPIPLSSRRITPPPSSSSTPLIEATAAATTTANTPSNAQMNWWDQAAYTTFACHVRRRARGAPRPQAQQRRARRPRPARGPQRIPRAPVRALWARYFAEAAARAETDPRCRGGARDLHASLAAWRVLQWLQTDEAVALGLGELYVEERMPHNWGTAVAVVGVLLKYLYDFAGEVRAASTTTSNTNEEEKKGE